MGVENQPWWDELLSLRSELSLRELASRFGASPGEISLALKRSGVRRTAPRPGGSAPQAAPPTERRGSKDAQLDAVRDRLGSVSDAEMAEEIGVSARTVASYRRRHNIAAFTGRSKPKKRFRRSKIDPFADLVGKLPDRVVAERANVTLNAVRNYRTNRGIASSRTYARQQRENARAVSQDAQVVPAAPAPVETPAANPPARPVTGGGFAWRIRFESGAEGVLTAAGVGEAARLATRLDPSVVSIERLGRLL